jgi:apolipoprotein N-acyltransferase
MAQVTSRRPTTRKPPQEKTAAAPVSAAHNWQPALVVFAVGLAGSLLLYGAFPPLDWPWLAWLAPIPWLFLVRLPALPGHRPYVMLWLAGCVHWLLMEYGIRMAHPALNAGWVALAAYLAVYLPVVIGLTRVAVHRLRISIVVAAPVVWVGLELLRGHFLGGFSMGLLAHTQADFPLLIQIADLAGGYTLSFVIMLVTACLTRLIPLRGAGVSPARPFVLQDLWPVLPVIAALAATLTYGQWRLAQTPPGHSGPSAKIALIQGSLDTVLIVTPERQRETLDQYASLTQQAAAQQQNLDLVVWPESMFVLAERQLEEGAVPPTQFAGPPEEFPKLVAALQSDFQIVLANMAAKANANTEPGGIGTHLLVGGNTIIYGPGRPRVFNAALLANRQGNLAGRYYKTQAVMFGEYIPIVDWFPWLYDWTPLPGGMSVGDGPRVFDIAGLRMSPASVREHRAPLDPRPGHATRAARDAGRCAGEPDQRRLVLGLLDARPASALQSVPGHRKPQAAGRGRQYGNRGFHRRQWRCSRPRRETPAQGHHHRGSRGRPRQPLPLARRLAGGTHGLGLLWTGLCRGAEANFWPG